MDKMGGTTGIKNILYTGSREQLEQKLRQRDDYITLLEDVIGNLEVQSNENIADGWVAIPKIEWDDNLKRLGGK